MKTSLLLFTALAASAALATSCRADDAALDTSFRDALYAEEVKGDPAAALDAYSKLLEQLEARRDLHATALFRQAECYRKLGKKDEAIAGFQKVLALYPDVERYQKQGKENLAALGVAAAKTMPVEDPVVVEREKQKQVIEKMLKESPDRINSKADNPLAKAVVDGDLEMVTFLLGKGALPNVHGIEQTALGKNWQPLTLAAHFGHKAICELLIEKGADVNSKDYPLLVALTDNHLQIVKLLLTRGANPNEDVLTGISPFSQDSYQFSGPVLLHALRSCSNEAFQILLEAKPELNRYMQSPSLSGSPQAVAISSFQPTKLKLLLDAGADVNFPADETYKTPILHHLLREMQSVDHSKETAEMLQLLLDKGVDWKSVDSLGNTAVHLLAHSDRVEWLRKAVAAGVDVNAQTKAGTTALMTASAAAVPVLLELNANPDLADHEGNTPLHLLGHSLDVLMKGNAAKRIPDVTLKNKSGMTALDLQLSDPKDTPEWRQRLLSLLQVQPQILTSRFPVNTTAETMWSPFPQGFESLQRDDPGKAAARLLSQHYLATRQAERSTGVWISLGVAAGTCGKEWAFVKHQSKSDPSSASGEAGAKGPGTLSAVMDTFYPAIKSQRVFAVDWDHFRILRLGQDGKEENIEVVPTNMEADVALEWGDIISLETTSPENQRRHIIAGNSFFLLKQKLGITLPNGGKAQTDAEPK